MIGLLLAVISQVYPTPTPPPTPEIPVGECVLAPLVPIVLAEDEVPVLILKCGMTSDSTRLFELPLDEDQQEALQLIIEALVEDDGRDDTFEVH